MSVDDRLDRIEQRLNRLETILAELRGRLIERERAISIGQWALPLVIGLSGALGIVFYKLGLWK